MDKKKILLLILAALLLAFFYPKSCGNWGTAINPDTKYKDCTCVGLKYSPALQGGAYINCFGVPVSYSCYKQEFSGTEVKKVSIPCE